MSKRKAIYVETTIDAEMDKLWDATQQPDQHEKWDLRFSSIHYLPKKHSEDKQHFTYETRIGFGVKIEGTGISQGQHLSKNGERVSSLSFVSDQRISLIKNGSGYWKYTPTESGIKFETLYDYEVRFGKVGTILDHLVFRPMIGWATAWSFDSLKKWLEDGVRPLDSLRRSLIHSILCVVMAFIWIYQGLVPKWLYPETGEVSLVQNQPLLANYAEQIVFIVGGIQILVGLAFFLKFRKKWLFLLSALAMIPLGLGALVLDSSTMVAPFNPAVLNIGVFGLGIVGWLNASDLVVARNCYRQRSTDK